MESVIFVMILMLVVGWLFLCAWQGYRENKAELLSIAEKRRQKSKPGYMIISGSSLIWFGVLLSFLGLAALAGIFHILFSEHLPEGQLLAGFFLGPLAANLFVAPLLKAYIWILEHSADKLIDWLHRKPIRT